jgi:hypothetical protein
MATRRSFYLPAAELDDQTVMDILGLVGESPSPEQVARWTPLEREVAVDYALRAHYRASDNPTRLRPRPSFLGSP